MSDVKAPPLQAKPTKAYMAKRKGEQKALKAQKAAEAGEPATRDVSALEQKKCWAKVEMWFKSTPCAVNAKTHQRLDQLGVQA